MREGPPTYFFEMLEERVGSLERTPLLIIPIILLPFSVPLSRLGSSCFASSLLPHLFPFVSRFSLLYTLTLDTRYTFEDIGGRPPPLSQYPQNPYSDPSSFLCKISLPLPIISSPVSSLFFSLLSVTLRPCSTLPLTPYALISSFGYNHDLSACFPLPACSCGNLCFGFPSRLQPFDFFTPGFCMRWSAYYCTTIEP